MNIKKVEPGSVNQAARPSFIIAGLSLVAGWLAMLQGGSVADDEMSIIVEGIAVIILGISIVASSVFFIGAKRWWKIPPIVYIVVSVIGMVLAYVIYSLRR